MAPLQLLLSLDSTGKFQAFAIQPYQDDTRKKVLAAKYMYGLSNIEPVKIRNLTSDLNSKVNGMKRLVAENAITLLNKQDDQFFPLLISTQKNKNNCLCF